jgi:hypothetical protein
MTLARIAAAACLLSAVVLAGCQPMQRDASLRLGGDGLGGKAGANARTWADPSSPRPDVPPDRDGGKF